MNSNFLQIVPQTYEEKVEMYMKLDKRKIVDMLIEANIHLDRLTNGPVQTGVHLNNCELTSTYGKF
jgi:hypothetical protein